MSNLTISFLALIVFIIGSFICLHFIIGVDLMDFVLILFILIIVIGLAFDSIGFFKPIEQKKINIMTEERWNMIKDNEIQYFPIDKELILHSIKIDDHTEIVFNTSSEDVSYIKYESKSGILFGELPPDKINIYLANKKGKK